MSGTLGDLKSSIEFNQHLTDILGVLKELAMGEYWRLEGEKRRFDKFKASFNSFFAVLNFSNIDHLQRSIIQYHPLFDTTNGQPVFFQRNQLEESNQLLLVPFRDLEM